jgi:metallo-beta-lactamase family protein
VRLLFSGDLGPGGRDYMPDPEGPSGVDHLILESTYGDRERPRVTPEDRRALLAEELKAAHAAGGPLLIPAFAVERSQELLADIMTIMDEGQAPEGDIFLDSPMASEVTEVFRQRGWNRATGVNPFTSLHGAGRLKFTPDPADSDRLEQLRGWHIVMAASGMCDAGRIRRHLKRLLWNREATVLITGYQAVGTLGRLLVDGARRVRIQGEDFGVRARIRSIEVYSGHADAGGLVSWAQARGPVRGSIFLDHGEPPALEGLARRLAEAGQAREQVIIPQVDQAYRLSPAGAVAGPAPPPRIAPGLAAAPDWHNARAQLILDLNERLEDMPPEAREALIRRIGELVAGAKET